MTDKLFIMPQQIQPITPQKAKISPEQLPQEQNLFGEILQKEIVKAGELKFSRHALERLETRNIKLGQQQLLRLQEGVGKAQMKGARESLVLVDDLAFVVSIKNKTVITAVDGENRKGNVFTNIDSAVIN